MSGTVEEKRIDLERRRLKGLLNELEEAKKAEEISETTFQEMKELYRQKLVDIEDSIPVKKRRVGTGYEVLEEVYELGSDLGIYDAEGVRVSVRRGDLMIPVTYDDVPSGAVFVGRCRFLIQTPYKTTKGRFDEGCVALLNPDDWERIEGSMVKVPTKKIARFDFDSLEDLYEFASLRLTNLLRRCQGELSIDRADRIPEDSMTVGFSLKEKYFFRKMRFRRDDLLAHIVVTPRGVVYKGVIESLRYEHDGEERFSYKDPLRELKLEPDLMTFHTPTFHLKAGEDEVEARTPINSYHIREDRVRYDTPIDKILVENYDRLGKSLRKAAKGFTLRHLNFFTKEKTEELLTKYRLFEAGVDKEERRHIKIDTPIEHIEIEDGKAVFREPMRKVLIEQGRVVISDPMNKQMIEGDQITEIGVMKRTLTKSRDAREEIVRRAKKIIAGALAKKIPEADEKVFDDFNINP